MITGDHISADKAREIKAVNRVYGDDFDDATRGFAETLASKPPLAIQAIKDSARAATEVGLAEGRKYDRRLGEPLFATEDFEEGARAFAEDDYDPDFQGQ